MLLLKNDDQSIALPSASASASPIFLPALFVLPAEVLFWCGSGRVRPSEDFTDELFKIQCARTKEEHFNFHKNLQCKSDLQGTARGGPARPLRRSSQIGRSV
ncbi:hypothetical protein PIB30_001973 [Stylosanthes scabra]|uniref:Uncharacterized protein n=1 Tax=Stylosanthes scabra TaxID=79078 RepID=A0ABU6YZP4_9FABA|nr:hypothetical protein [Stylosanthes scabra]